MGLLWALLSGVPVWSVRHGQFLIMGGIHLVEPPVQTAKVQPTVTQSTLFVSGTDVEKGLIHPVTKGRVTILTLEMLRELVKDEAFEIRLTEDEISDRSKGNGISKLIFILMSSWFIVQCIARHIQGLDSTQLELTTFAIASLNAVTTLLWWKKPLSAQAIVHVYLPRRLTQKERNVPDDKTSEVTDDGLTDKGSNEVTEVSIFFASQSYSYQQL